MPLTRGAKACIRLTMRAAVTVQLPLMVIHLSFRFQMFHKMVTLVLRGTNALSAEFQSFTEVLLQTNWLKLRSTL